MITTTMPFPQMCFFLSEQPFNMRDPSSVPLEIPTTVKSGGGGREKGLTHTLRFLPCKAGRDLLSDNFQ